MASSSSAGPPAVRVVEQCRISPGPDGPFGDVSIPITFFDVPWLENHPFAASALPRFKRSLSLVLRHYYPLAGRVRRRVVPGAASNKVDDVFCTDGDYVPFTLAELCADDDGGGGRCYFDHLAGDHPRQVESFRPLVPEIPESFLMVLQVTVFQGAGVCIDVSISHLACDGCGFVSFLKAWASVCRSEDNAGSPAGALPVIDRTLVSGTTALYRATFDFQKYLTGVARPSVDGNDVVHSTFLLRRSHMEELRRRRPLPQPLRYSSFVLTCAYVWVCLLKAHGGQELQTPPPEQGLGDAAHFMFAVDCRSRLRPPLPAAYFGNCIRPCFVDDRRGDLLGDDGVAHAAEAIAESVAHMREDDVLRGAQEWMPMIAARLPRQLLSTAGLPRFGVYELDFGWGRPAKVEVVGIERSGAMALADSREDDGGIEVGLALLAPKMAKFSSLFAAGLEDAGGEESRK
ncbi:hypothetical protein Taro_042866 [Colocasia esculenta]|uniref:Uncharacterized protein n=1 Tax=Colocasia esculenta TaxID=4460 RepID=A0A843WEZ6_COLES|nr:hypothetical protein [Colocasia esculenta]